jgi:hypothetical protein
MNRRRSEWKQSWPNLRYDRGICPERLRKPLETSMSTVEISTDIRISDFPNKSRNHYSLSLLAQSYFWRWSLNYYIEEENNLFHMWIHTFYKNCYISSWINHLKTEFLLNNAVSIRQETHYVSAMKTNRLMLFRRKILCLLWEPYDTHCVGRMLSSSVLSRWYI